eukprot:6407751-Ditylum_brightwellii.AAC.2
MESGAHVWAAAPGLDPGQYTHFSGGEKEVAYSVVWDVNGASVLAASMRKELRLPAGVMKKGSPTP